MDYTALKLELRARVESLSEPRAGQFINDAYQELCELYPWPFLETTATITPPTYDLADVRKVLELIDTVTGRKLSYVSHNEATESDPLLDDTGDPVVWFFSDPDTLATNPTNSNPLRCRYIKIPPALSSGSDTPLVPSRYQSLIVDMAQLRAVRRHDENQAILPYLQQAVRLEQERMCGVLFRPSNEALSIIATGSY